MSTENHQPALVIGADALTNRVDHIVDVFEDDEGELWRVLERIVEEPHRELKRDVRSRSLAEVGTLEPGLILHSLLEPSGVALTRRLPHFKTPDHRWRFLRAHSARNVLDQDTPANRFVAHVIRKLSVELRRLVRRMKELDNDGLSDWIHDAQDVSRRLHAFLQRSPAIRNATRLENVPLNNLVLRHDSRYRAIMDAYLELL